MNKTQQRKTVIFWAIIVALGTALLFFLLTGCARPDVLPDDTNETTLDGKQAIFCTYHRYGETP